MSSSYMYIEKVTTYMYVNVYIGMCMYVHTFVRISTTISSLGRQDLVTQFLVKITFLYKLVAKKLDFVLSKLQISI